LFRKQNKLKQERRDQLVSHRITKQQKVSFALEPNAPALRTATKARRLGVLTRAVILFCNSVLPHVPKTRCTHCTGPRLVTPYLSRCEFRVSGPLQKPSKGRRFGSREDIQAVFVRWLEQKSGVFFAKGSMRRCVSAMPAGTPKVYNLNGFGTFHQNNP
jgi:hypothetical protein